MFLRPNFRHKDGKAHTYWSLVETVRTPDGPRQRTLCYLGELNDPARARWLKTIEVFNEQGESQQLKLFPSDVEPPPADGAVARVRLDHVRLERSRRLGDCFLGLQLWKRLVLDRFWEALLDRPDDPADVPWSRVAALLAINRLCAPGSELAVEERWYPSTALDDLLEIEEGKINDTRLYRCLDRLLPHKTKLERHLKERYGELFAAEFDVLLYDLTSSYVEGAAEKDPMRQRGDSRDHWPDCKQVVIALIVNGEGFPLSYETFDGHRTDVITVEAVLRMVERKYGKARRVWVFDRGIVSEENLAALRKRGGQYRVGTPRAKLKQFEKQLLEEGGELSPGWFPITPPAFEKQLLEEGGEQVRPEVEVKLVATPEDEETYILCRSTARQAKEQAIHSRFSARMEKGLTALAQRVAEGQLKDRNKIERRVGKIQARHPQVADLYEVQVAEKSGAFSLEWQALPGRQKWRHAREGAYLLRTNLPSEEPGNFWKSYIQLTEAEAAFRALKSELSVRPIFRQLERRAKAHILVAFLGYALWVTLKHLLIRKGSGLSPAKALGLMNTLVSADIVLPTTDGREIRLRRVTAPSEEQKQLLTLRGIAIPQRLSFAKECSVDSATA